MEHIEFEKHTVRRMIRLYCRKKEGNKELCTNCSTLLEYALKRLEQCRFKNEKPACKKCTVHCYAPGQREQIRKIMRYSGPRLLFYHPLAAIRHLMNF